MLNRSIVTLRQLARRMFASFISAADLATIPPVTWLVKGLLPAGSVAVVFGPSGGGKTFWAIDLMLRISAGMSWYGRKTEPGLVLMLAGEGSRGVKARVDAFLKHHGKTYADVAFDLRASVIDLTNNDDVTALILAARKKARLAKKRLAAICIDTFARAAAAADENSNSAMSLVLEACTRIARETGATVVLIHHSGHGSDRARGATAIRAAVDTEIAIFPEGDELRVTVTKQKEAEELPEMRFRKIAISLGHDQDGDPLGSLVLDLNDSPRPGKPSGRQQFGREHYSLLAVLESAGGGLTNAQWRAACVAEGFECGNAKWYRLRDELLAAGKVDQDGPNFSVSGGRQQVSAKTLAA